MLSLSHTMKTSEPTNPYSPDSQSLALAPVGQSVRVRTWIGLALGIMLLAGDLLVAIRIPYLYIRYPGLNDRSRAADDAFKAGRWVDAFEIYRSLPTLTKLQRKQKEIAAQQG